MKQKDLISIKDGRRIGHIIDAEINKEGQILYLVVEEKKNLRKMMISNTDSKISFKSISKIGEDVILVDM